MQSQHKGSGLMSRTDTSSSVLVLPLPLPLIQSFYKSRRHPQVKGSFCLGQGQSHGTQALPDSAPIPPCTSSCAVSSLPKVFEALLQYQRRHAHRPAHSSHVLAPHLFGLQRLPMALPLRKMLPPLQSPSGHSPALPCSCPQPCGAAQQRASGSSQHGGSSESPSTEGLWQQQQPVAGASGPGRALPLAAHAGYRGRNSLLSSGDARPERAARQAGLLHRFPAS